MSANDDENYIVCLNYCMADPETGYCLTCGRPPIPVVPLSASFRSDLMAKIAQLGDADQPICAEGLKPR